MFSSKTIRSLWGALGSFWGALFYNLVKKWTSNSEHLPLKSAACHQKMTSRNSSAGIRGCAQSDIWPAARNPPSLAPGARMTWVHNKLSQNRERYENGLNGQKSSFCSWWYSGRPKQFKTTRIYATKILPTSTGNSEICIICFFWLLFPRLSCWAD